jgi:NhaP-type Na+/H+ or K+/H+ antiporter
LSIVLSTLYASAAAILRDYAHIDSQLRSLRDVLWFIVFTVIVSVLLAVISVPALIDSGAVPAAQRLGAIMRRI